MEYIRVRNWEQFQHYGKSRSTPPWIKLYNSLLDSIEWSELPDSSKAHLVGLFLLASRTDNRIPASPAWIQQRIGARSRVDLKPLLAAKFIERTDHASNVLATDASADKSREEESRGEENRSDQNRKEGGGFAPPSVDQVQAFKDEHDLDNLDPEAFVDFYASKGWKVGNASMKDWHAAARNWHRRHENGNGGGNGSSYTPRLRRPADDSDLIALARQYHCYDKMLSSDALWRRILTVWQERQ